MKKYFKIFQLVSLLCILAIFNSCENYINKQRECNLKTTFVDKANIIPYSDESIINFSLYGQKYPNDFYNEETKNIASIYYVNTVSTKLDNTKWIQLCTDDRNEATNWIKISSKREKIELTETEKYFQFISIDTTSSYKILFRVHKCSYLDRTIYDALNSSDSLGILNKRPINEQSTKEVIEYLWFNEYYAIGNPKVFYTNYSEDSENCLYQIYVVNYTDGDFGMCPSITVEKQNYIVNKTTGLITKKIKIIRTISD